MSHGGSHESTFVETVPTAEQLKAIYTPAFAQDARISDILRVLDAILARDAEEDLSTAEILSAISSLRDLILAQNNEITYLHTLIGKLVFELLNQGIEIQDEELLEQINYI